MLIDISTYIKFIDEVKPDVLVVELDEQAYFLQEGENGSTEEIFLFGTESRMAAIR